MRRPAFLLVCLALTLALSGASAAAATLWENLQQSIETQKQAEAALKNVMLPPALENKLLLLAGERLLEDPNTDLGALLKTVAGGLSAGEQLQVSAWFTARETRNAADRAVAAAQKAYYDEMVKKDQAMKTAEAAFTAEQQYLEQEKTAIQSLPRDDAYLDRVSRLLERLKKAYTKMNGDLAPYVDSFGDARSFVTDKEERLKKIAALEAEITRRRGKGGAGTEDAATGGSAQAGAHDSTTAARADPQAPGPLGDTYTCSGPTITPAIHGTITRADATGIEIEVMENGQPHRARIRFTKGPPSSIRINERFEFSMTAEGEHPAYAFAAVYAEEIISGAIPGVESSCSNLPTWRAKDPAHAAYRCYFGVRGKGEFKVNAGRYNSDNVWIVWKYTKAGN